MKSGKSLKPLLLPCDFCEHFVRAFCRNFEWISLQLIGLHVLCMPDYRTEPHLVLIVFCPITMIDNWRQRAPSFSSLRSSPSSSSFSSLVISAVQVVELVVLFAVPLVRTRPTHLKRVCGSLNYLFGKREISTEFKITFYPRDISLEKLRSRNLTIQITLNCKRKQIGFVQPSINPTPRDVLHPASCAGV